MFDIHNHILPGLDDGAKSLGDALELLRLAAESGITHLVCTPHIHPGRYDNCRDTIETAFIRFCQQEAVQAIPVRLAMAAEVRISDEILVLHQQQQLPFIGQWQGYSVLLLELPHDRLPMGLNNFISWLKQQKILALIAHPERNRELMRRPEMAARLVDQGALLQLTAASVTGGFGPKAEALAHWLLDRKLAGFIASDAHHPTRRPLALAEARRVISEQYDQHYAEALCINNPRILTQELFKGDCSAFS